jgi:hypothetical protein
MQRKSLVLACVMACGALLPAAAHATITDSLTGPSDIEVRQSALTATTTVDPNAQFVTSYRNNGFGNSRFGASYTATSWAGALGTNVAFVYDYASADATVFGSTQNMLSDAVYAVTNGNTQTANLYDNIYAFGYQVRNDSRAGGEFPNGVALSSFSQNLWKSGDQTFYIGPIPVTVSAEVFAGAGQTAQGHFWVDGVSGTLSQYAKLWANAKGGVGVSWAGGGVSVNNLSLVNASLPLTATARFNDYNYNGCSEWLSLSANYGLSLQELSGEVRIWGKMLFWSDDYKIASWPGLRQDFNMLNYSGWAWSGTCFPKPAAPIK